MKLRTKHIANNGLLITIGFLLISISMSDEVIQIPKVEEKLNTDETVNIVYQKESNSVKKALAPEFPKLPVILEQEEESQPSKAQEQAPKEQSPASASASADVVISEAATPQVVELKQLNDHVGTAHSVNKITESSAGSSGSGGGGSRDNDVHIVSSSRIQQTFLTNDMDMPDAYRAGVYFFFGISSAAIFFIVVRVYRLRLSRAERKYGVQGDRANQELTPLPMAIEDINSDEDDHTLFEINRHNIRIL